MASPRPAPPCLRDRLGSTRYRRSNTCAASRVVIPGPVSTTSTAATRRPGVRSDPITTVGGNRARDRRWTADPHHHRRVVRGVLQGVGDQIGDHLPDPRLVSQRRHRLEGVAAVVDPGQADEPVRHPHVRVTHRVRRHRQQVHRLAAQRSLLVQAGQQQHVVDQQSHPADFGLDPPHRLVQRRVAGGAPPRRYSSAKPWIGGERGAQFMGGVGE